MRTLGRFVTLTALLGLVGNASPGGGGRATKSDRELLQGTWVCVATTKDGKKVESYLGVRAVIEGDNLTWYFPEKDGSYREQRNKFKIDPAKNPKHFDWWPVDKPESVDRRLYSVAGDVLRWSTNLDFKTRPGSFEAGRWTFTAKRVQRIKGWGTVVDPDGDRTVRERDGKVTIKVPAGVHDLWFGRKEEKNRFNAPRVWQQVEGGFVAQVKVSADWASAARPAPDFYFHGAGVVVWDSEKQYVRLERTVFTNSKGTFSFTTPLQDQGGKRINAWKTAGADFFKGRSTWLRVERAADKLTTAISHDGKKWSQTSVLTTELPRKVRIGVLAINNSAREFTADFEGFTINKK